MAAPREERPDTVKIEGMEELLIKMTAIASANTMIVEELKAVIANIALVEAAVRTSNPLDVEIT